MFRIKTPTSPLSTKGQSFGSKTRAVDRGAYTPSVSFNQLSLLLTSRFPRELDKPIASLAASPVVPSPTARSAQIRLHPPLQIPRESRELDKPIKSLAASPLLSSPIARSPQNRSHPPLQIPRQLFISSAFGSPVVMSPTETEATRSQFGQSQYLSRKMKKERCIVMWDPFHRLGRGSEGNIYSALIKFQVDTRKFVSYPCVIKELWLDNSPEFEHQEVITRFNQNASSAETCLLRIIEHFTLGEGQGKKRYGILPLCDVMLDQLVDRIIDLSEEKPDLYYNVIADVITNVMKGIFNLRKMGMIHYDLKFENIGLHGGSFCVLDFGSSRQIDEELQSPPKVTPGYCPPETIRGNQTVEITLSKQDVYALGQMLRKLLKLPYQFAEHNGKPYLVSVMLAEKACDELRQQKMQSETSAAASASSVPNEMSLLDEILGCEDISILLNKLAVVFTEPLFEERLGSEYLDRIAVKINALRPKCPDEDLSDFYMSTQIKEHTWSPQWPQNPDDFEDEQTPPFSGWESPKSNASLKM